LTEQRVTLFSIKAQATHIVVSADASQEAQAHTGARSLLQANNEEGSNFYMVINFFVMSISVLTKARTYPASYVFSYHYLNYTSVAYKFPLSLDDYGKCCTRQTVPSFHALIL
jgi:hypothetical protein